MYERNGSSVSLPVGSVPGAVAGTTSQDMLSDLLRQGAQRMLTQAIEAEVSEWIERHAEVRDERGRRQVVRNGHLPSRTIVTGLGPLEVT